MQKRPSNSLAEEEEEDNSPLASWTPIKGPEESEQEHSDLIVLDGSDISGRSSAAGTPIASATDFREAASETARVGEEKSETMIPVAREVHSEKMLQPPISRRQRLRKPWTCSWSSLLVALAGILLVWMTIQSFLSRQVDVKGCAMSYMRPGYARFSDFDTEHTRFASKYSLYLYREGGIDEDTRVM